MPGRTLAGFRRPAAELRAAREAGVVMPGGSNRLERGAGHPDRAQSQAATHSPIRRPAPGTSLAAAQV
jgi:hypothetical protein